MARKHKVFRCVRFVGRAEHDNLLRLLHRVDVAVLPSHYEPFGIVALEAAAAGSSLSPRTSVAWARRSSTGRPGCHSRRAMLPPSPGRCVPYSTTPLPPRNGPCRTQTPHRGVRLAHRG